MEHLSFEQSQLAQMVILVQIPCKNVIPALGRSVVVKLCSVLCHRPRLGSILVLVSEACDQRDIEHLLARFAYAILDCLFVISRLFARSTFALEQLHLLIATIK